MGESLSHQTKKGLYWKFFDQFATIGMQFIVGIFMARVLSPTDYGITALPAVFLTIANIFIDGSFAAALIRKKELTEKDLSTSFYYSLGVGALMYILLFFAAPYIAEFYKTPILTSLVRVTAITFFLGPLTTPQTVILTRKLDFKTPARISVINKTISGIIGIVMAYTGFGLWSLVVSSLSASFLGLIQIWLAVKWIPRERFSKESFSYLWNFGNKLIIQRLIDTAYSNIAPLLLGKLGSTADLGNYYRAKGYAALPSTNIVGVLTSVTFPVLSKLQDEKERLSYNYRRMIKVSAFVCFPMMILLASLSRPLILVMITEKWESCILLLQILCFAFMWQPIQMLNVNLLQVLGRTDLTLKLEIIKKPVCAIVIVVALYFGVVYFCVAEVLLQLFALAINTYYTGKFIKVGFWSQMKDIAPAFLMSIFSGGIVLAVNYFISNLFLQILVGGIIGLASYLAIALITRRSEINEVKYLLTRKK